MGPLLIICDIIITIVKVTINSTTMDIKGILTDIKPITANVIIIMVIIIITEEDTAIHTTIITRDGEPIKDPLIPPTITELTTDTIKVRDSNLKLHAVVHSLMILLLKHVWVMINLIIHIMIYIMLITRIIHMICHQDNPHDMYYINDQDYHYENHPSEEIHTQDDYDQHDAHPHYLDNINY